MQKFYLITCAIIACVFLTDKIYGQAPASPYPAAVTLPTGQKITDTIGPKFPGGFIPTIGTYSLTKTIAGSGYYGHKDTVAAFASFTNPVGIAQFGGIYYIADANSNCIRKIENGVVSTFAGSVKGDKGGLNGQDTSARFNYPTSVTVDGNGNVYVADFGNSLIRKITPRGFVSTFAGNQNSGWKDGVGKNAKFNLPYAICFDSGTGLLWVADTYNQRIRKISTLGDTTVTTVAGNGVAGLHNGALNTATFNTPKGITVDKLGFIYVTEEGNNCVRRFRPADGFITTFATGKLDKPGGIAVDDRQNVYVSCYEKFGIYKFGPDGKLADSTKYPAFSGGDLKGYFDGADTLTKYSGNMGLLYNGSSLIVSDPGNDRIREVSLQGYRVYPRLPDSLTLSAVGDIQGTPTTVAPAKTYAITAYALAATYNYTIKITISKGPQVIAFDAIKPVTYGDKDFAPAATSNSSATIIYKSDNANVATIVSNKVHVVGAGTANITASQAANDNYGAAQSVIQKLTVNKAKLYASVYHYFKVKGKDNPDFTIYYNGFFHGDTTSVITDPPVAQTTATKDSPEGDYPITLSGGTAANYDFAYTGGTLTVFPEPTITATGSTYIASGDSVLLSVTPSTGYDYQWSLNGSKIKGATKASYYADQTGAYTVAITKDSFTATSLYIPVNVQLQLPPDNFSIKVNSVSCKGDNNGAIFISAAKPMKYIATVTINSVPKQYPFTDTLTLGALSPGNYPVCISVENEIFNQCYQLNVTEPKDLSAFSTIDKPSNSLTLQLDGGSSYNINLNDAVYTTTNNQITLPLQAGVNKVVITTDRLCQGVIEKIFDLTNISAPYPNPFTGILNVNIGSSVVNNIKIDVVSVLNGKSVYTGQLTNRSGVLQVDLSSIADGIYYFNLNLDNKKLGYKIIKK